MICYLLKQSFISRNIGWNMSHVKEDMKCCVISDQSCIATVSEVKDGVNGVLKIRPGSIH